MTARIGMGVSADSVCAVLTRARAIEWSGIENVDEQGLEAALTRLLSRLPRLSWPKPRVHAGIATGHAHVKTIHGLPQIRDARALGRIVTASPGRFFVVSPGTATVTGVRLLEDGVARAAIIKNETIAAIQSACRSRGLALARVIPGEIALSCLFDDEPLDSSALGLGAALLDRREPIVVRPRRLTMAERTVGTSRLALAASVATATVLAAMTLPTLVTIGNASTARREVASLAPERARILSTRHELTEAARMLATVSSFERERTSVTWLLHQLAKALPANALIVSIKSDSAAVTLGALATRATEVVSAIHDMPGASNVEMIGAITYEGARAEIGAAAAAKAFERVTVRFRLAPDPADLRTPFVSEPGAKQ